MKTVSYLVFLLFFACGSKKQTKTNPTAEEVRMQQALSGKPFNFSGYYTGTTDCGFYNQPAEKCELNLEILQQESFLYFKVSEEHQKIFEYVVCINKNELYISDKRQQKNLQGSIGREALRWAVNGHEFVILKGSRNDLNKAQVSIVTFWQEKPWYYQGLLEVDTSPSDRVISANCQ